VSTPVLEFYSFHDGKLHARWFYGDY